MLEKIKFHLEKIKNSFSLVYDEDKFVEILVFNKKFEIQIKKGQVGLVAENLDSIKDIKNFCSNKEVIVPAFAKLRGNIVLLNSPVFLGNTKISDSTIVAGVFENSTIIESTLENVEGEFCSIYNSDVSLSELINSNITKSTVTNSTIIDSRISGNNICKTLTNDVISVDTVFTDANVEFSTFYRSMVSKATISNFLVNDSNIDSLITMGSELMSAVPVTNADIKCWFDYGCVGRYVFYRKKGQKTIANVTTAIAPGSFSSKDFASFSDEDIGCFQHQDNKEVSFLCENFNKVSNVNLEYFLAEKFNSLSEGEKDGIKSWFRAYFMLLTKYFIDIFSDNDFLSNRFDKKLVRGFVINQMSFDFKTKTLAPASWRFIDFQSFASVNKELFKKDIRSFDIYSWGCNNEI